MITFILETNKGSVTLKAKSKSLAIVKAINLDYQIYKIEEVSG